MSSRCALRDVSGEWKLMDHARAIGRHQEMAEFVKSLPENRRGEDMESPLSTFDKEEDENA